MRLALGQGYSGATLSGDVSRVLEAERLGYDSVWTAESYGSDAVTTIAWIAARTTRIHVGTAIMQIGARTPAATAMTAMTLDALSGGRFRLGLGVSNPQVIEGWHGQRFGKPLARTREYVAIVRAILRREKPVEFAGGYYQIPYAGPDATGLGKPLKSILHGRADLPIYLAAIGPRNVALAAVRALAIAEGVDAALLAEWKLSHPDLPALSEAAKKIQDLYLAGRKAEAEAAVPDALVDEVGLFGSRERIRERLAAYREAGVTTLAVRGNLDAVRLMAELVL